MAISENIKSSISVSINDGDARQRLEQLRQRIARLNKERETLMQKPLDLRTDKEQKRIETLTRQLTSANKELTRVRAVGTEVVNTLSKLDTASAKELERTIKSLRREMESGSIERGSELWNKYSTALRAAENELEAVRAEMRGVANDTETNIGGSLKGIGSFVEKLTNAFQRMRAWAEPYVEAFAAIDDEMVGVMKYTGLARTEVEQLDQALLQINTRTTHEQLLQLAQDAGRLGIQSKEDILAFVRAADTINLALGEDLGEDAIRNIAKLAQIFGDAELLGLERAMLATASTINELAQSSTAAEPYLAEFASRLGSIGATAGLTQAQILAYASVMDQSGINVERAATALQNVIMRLYQDPAKAAEVAGLEVKAFTDLIRTDANDQFILRNGYHTPTLRAAANDSRTDLTIRILRSFHVKYQRKLPELIDDFAHYYQHHPNRGILFYYDSTALGSNYAVNTDDLRQVIIRALQKHHFTPRPIPIGAHSPTTKNTYSSTACSPPKPATAYSSTKPPTPTHQRKQPRLRKQSRQRKQSRRLKHWERGRPRPHKAASPPHKPASPPA